MSRGNRYFNYFRDSRNWKQSKTETLSEEEENREDFEFESEDKQEHVFNPNKMQGRFIFKSEKFNKNLKMKPFYGDFIFDSQTICLIEDIKESDENPIGENTLEKFNNLSETRQKSILYDHEIFCSSLIHASPWQFMTYKIDSINFMIPGFNDFSPEEIRLCFYLSYDKEDLFNLYIDYMDKYNKEYEQNVKIILSNDFFELFEIDQFRWSNSSNRINNILTHYESPFNKNGPLIEKIDKNCHTKLFPDKTRANQWYSLPEYSIPHEYLINSDDDFLNNIKDSLQFPTKAYNFDETFPLLGDIFCSKIGYQFYQHNSYTKSFEGPYSHDSNISKDEIQLLNEEEYVPESVPLFPPSRKMIT